jgi:hypothetical protein
MNSRRLMQSIPDLILAGNGSSQIIPAPNAMSFTTMGRVTTDAVVEDLLRSLHRRAWPTAAQT